ncbi:TetR/AcrR family transcriptional regulator [Actinomyces sp. MRS3W]|uniref:TetR/AcrR family transcriptional regulator n=1 Tax=Actinomyces sp. MRS3W TaxID=2800796 RepID=UPI0028FD51A6|nr:TetR/AcrR family transcriptional regulator [Actinomyces sp. MRS3W]MDU0347628.1 TetR/AcrR family transcriptional regulator [Actinomyces sp. MRS3W]
MDNPIRTAGARLSARREAVQRLIGDAPSERRAQTQALLLASGRALIADKGIGGTSVGDICSRAGFTRGAFYSNFTDMDHFVQRLAEEQWDAITHFVDNSVAQELSDPPQAASPTDAELAAGLTELASRLLGAMPLSREVFLLQNEFAAYIARADGDSSPLRDGYAAFKQHLGNVLVEGLASIDRECLLTPEDTTELILSTATRSMRMALTEGPVPLDASQSDANHADVAAAGPGDDASRADLAHKESDAGKADTTREEGAAGRTDASRASANDPDLTAFLGRTLPTLLARLSTPIAPADAPGREDTDGRATGDKGGSTGANSGND